MGLDTVEIVLRVEEVFTVELPNEECGQLRTVGDLYRLVLNKLNLEYLSGAEIDARALGHSRNQDQLTGLIPWNTHDVWRTIKGIIEDQLQMNPNEVTEEATFLEDLRCD